jgi:2-polyprenyl-6-methoxyphenol hydroxylase-like FAD-dependent oxidoreductase
VILGDAANATAPNLAQGAGLAIKSVWDFISMVNISNYHGLNEYILKRKKRA